MYNALICGDDCCALGKSLAKALREMMAGSGAGGRRNVAMMVASVGAMVDAKSDCFGSAGNT